MNKMIKLNKQRKYKFKIKNIFENISILSEITRMKWTETVLSNTKQFEQSAR